MWSRVGRNRDISIEKITASRSYRGLRLQAVNRQYNAGPGPTFFGKLIMPKPQDPTKFKDTRPLALSHPFAVVQLGEELAYLTYNSNLDLACRSLVYVSAYEGRRNILVMDTRTNDSWTMADAKRHLLRVGTH